VHIVTHIFVMFAYLPPELLSLILISIVYRAVKKQGAYGEVKRTRNRNSNNCRTWTKSSPPGTSLVRDTVEIQPGSYIQDTLTRKISPLRRNFRASVTELCFRHRQLPDILLVDIFILFSVACSMLIEDDTTAAMVADNAVKVQHFCSRFARRP
jgi:hypothetical protein